MARNEKAKALGKNIQICTKQPKNLQRLVGGLKDEHTIGRKMPNDAGCTSSTDAMHALSFTKIQVLKAQVLAKFIKSYKTSVVTVLGSFNWALSFLPSHQRNWVKNMEFLAEREVFWQHQLRVFVENGSRNHCYRKDMWSKFSSTQLVMTYLFNWCNFILVVKHLLSLVLSCWLADLIMDSESLRN